MVLSLIPTQDRRKSSILTLKKTLVLSLTESVNNIAVNPNSSFKPKKGSSLEFDPQPSYSRSKISILTLNKSVVLSLNPTQNSCKS